MDTALAPPALAFAEAPPPDTATVLTVDDEASVLSALQRLFRRKGYRVLQAGSGAEGLALLREQAVDLVISDMRMPGMDGAEFLQAVRAHDPGIVRMLLTGNADIRSTIAAINRGEIHCYIAKPWDDEDLALVVRDALLRRQLERRNAELAALTKAQNEELRLANQTLESRVAARTAELSQVNGMLETAFEDLDRTFVLAVNVFSGLLEMREGQAGHSRRVAELARDTAMKLGLREREARDVHLAALVHDVGKIGFPDRMLGKPVSAYNVEELARYRRHPVDGETALMPLAQLQNAARIVRQHHERHDGKGFPDGLAGSAIHLGARILAAASTYDNLVHGGHSEARFTAERAAQWLKEHSGTHFDPNVVTALLQVLAEHAAREQAGVQIDVRDLKPGMVLSRDLTSPQGAILLAAGYVFDARIIRQVCDFANREGLRLTLHVRREAPPNPAPTTAPAALAGATL